MASIPRVRGGPVNIRWEVSRRVNAACQPNDIHRPGEEARGIHARSEILLNCPEDTSIRGVNHVENDNEITNNDIVGECSSHPVATQDHLEISEQTTTNLEADISSVEDMKELQGPSAQSSADGAQSTAQRLGNLARENPILAAATLVTGAGVAVVAAPALITAPIMGIAGMAGFTPTGIAGASIASALQASIGNVAAGSIFATVQSAAAGGYGVAALAGTAQAVGGAVAGAGSIGTAWTWLRGKPKAVSPAIESPPAEPSQSEPPKQ